MRRNPCSVQRCKRRVNRICQGVGLCDTHLLQRADKLFSQFIRERDRKCVVCGGNHKLQCMHIVSRRYRRLRWDERNAVAGCLMCHAEFTNKPLEWEDWVDHEYGDGTWSQLRAEALEGVPDWRVLALEFISTYQRI